MADQTISVGSGIFKRMRDMLNGSHAEAVASSSIVYDSTGAYSFDLASLASVPTYDASGNMVTVTYGPDAAGRSIRQTSVYVNGVWQGDSAWVLV